MVEVTTSLWAYGSTMQDNIWIFQQVNTDNGPFFENSKISFTQSYSKSIVAVLWFSMISSGADLRTREQFNAAENAEFVPADHTK